MEKPTDLNMKKIVKTTLITLSILFFIIALLIFRPVPIVTEDNTITEQGVVSSIYSNEGNDIIFTIENTQRRFYINRGLENGLELNDLKQRLIGNEIVLKYPKYWTPLDWNNTVRHVSKVQFKDEVLFNELKQKK